MKATPFLAGGKDLSLRYENKQQQDIKHNAPKRFGITKKFASPMEILNYLDDTDVQVYVLQKGLEWAGSGIEKITEEMAGQLRQDYLEEGEADAGEKYKAFQNLIADALSLNVMGASGKKLIEASQEKSQTDKTEDLARIYEAKILSIARARTKFREERAQKKLSSEQPSGSSE